MQQQPQQPQQPLNIQIRPEELRPVECEACGAVRRLVLGWQEIHAHRLQPDFGLTKNVIAWLCMGCGVQLDAKGAEVAPEDPGRLSGNETHFLRGGRCADAE